MSGIVAACHVQGVSACGLVERGAAGERLKASLFPGSVSQIGHGVFCCSVEGVSLTEAGLDLGDIVDKIFTIAIGNIAGFTGCGRERDQGTRCRQSQQGSGTWFVIFL